MARIRSIKPEFWTSSQIVECSTNARLLFVGMWNFCDDWGRHPYDPKRLKMCIFPGDDDLPTTAIAAMMGELERAKLILPYTVNGCRYFVVSGWHHQKIDRPQDAKYPAPEQGTFEEHSTNEPRTLDERSSLIGKDRIGRDRKGKDRSGRDNTLSGKPDRSADILQVFAHYRTYHPKSHPKPSCESKEWRAVRQRLEDGYTVEQLKMAIDGNHRMPFYCGVNDRNKAFHSLELIVRSSSKVSEFIDGAESCGPVLSERTQRNLSAAESYLARRESGSDPISIGGNRKQPDHPGIGVQPPD